MPWPFGKLKEVMENPALNMRDMHCKACLLLVGIDR